MGAIMKTKTIQNIGKLSTKLKLKLIRKLAYVLLHHELESEYVTADVNSIYNEQGKKLKLALKPYFNSVLTSDFTFAYCKLLDMFSHLGYIPGEFKLEAILKRNLYRILILAIKSDQNLIEVDD